MAPRHFFEFISERSAPIPWHDSAPRLHTDASAAPSIVARANNELMPSPKLAGIPSAFSSSGVNYVKIQTTILLLIEILHQVMFLREDLLRKTIILRPIKGEIREPRSKLIWLEITCLRVYVCLLHTRV